MHGFSGSWNSFVLLLTSKLHLVNGDHVYLFCSIFWHISNRMQLYTIYFWKLLYMFRVVSQPIIRSTHNCIYNIWHLSNRNCYLPLSWKRWNCSVVPTHPVTVTVWQVPDVVDTVVCAPDDWWRSFLLCRYRKQLMCDRHTDRHTDRQNSSEISLELRVVCFLSTHFYAA